MEKNGGFLVTQIKQLGDRIFEKILSEKNIDAFNGAQGRIALWCASIFKWVCGGGKKHDRANKLEVVYFFFFGFGAGSSSYIA